MATEKGREHSSEQCFMLQSMLQLADNDLYPNIQVILKFLMVLPVISV